MLKMLDESTYIFIPMFLLIILGMGLGIAFERRKIDTDELFFLKHCVANNDGEYNAEVINQCRTAFEIYRDKGK